jgi:DnaK suppressor protein
LEIREYDTSYKKINTPFPEGRSPSMATAKPAKKKKSGLAKKPAPMKKKKVEKPAKRAVPQKPEKKVRRKGKTMAKAGKTIHPARGTVAAKTEKSDKEEARKKLLEMREKILSGISEKPIPEALVSQTDIGDIIDQAGDERERELSLLLSVRDKEKLHAINEALEKVKEDTYGICEECGEKIGPARLMVMPLARYCVSCQAKLEKEMSLQRKAEEELTYRGGLTYSGGSEEEEG